MFVLVCFNPYNQVEDVIGLFDSADDAARYADSAGMILAYVHRVYPPQ